MTSVRYPWVVDVRDGKTRIDWKWLVLSLIAGAVTVALANLLLPGWLAAVVVIVLAVLAITADVVIRRHILR
jgi:hypothetical protein